MVSSDCLSANGKANENCTWISGDGIFVARAQEFDASSPQSLNNPSVWSFWSGSSVSEHGRKTDKWSADVRDAKPVFQWRGRVGAVTATWEPFREVYLFCVTAPAVSPSAISGPYDTVILEAPSLTGPFSTVSMLPSFGAQAYFVSLPSAWLDADGGGGVLTFSANYHCVSFSCAPNIKGAGYGATLLPIRFVKSSLPSRETEDIAQVLNDTDWANSRVSDDPVLPNTPNLSACVALCAARRDCVAVSWTSAAGPPADVNTCSLKCSALPSQRITNTGHLGVVVKPGVTVCPQAIWHPPEWQADIDRGSLLLAGPKQEGGHVGNGYLGVWIKSLVIF